MNSDFFCSEKKSLSNDSLAFVITELEQENKIIQNILNFVQFLNYANQARFHSKRLFSANHRAHIHEMNSKAIAFIYNFCLQLLFFSRAGKWFYIN